MKTQSKTEKSNLKTHSQDMAALQVDYAAAATALKVVEAKLGTMPTVGSVELRNSIRKATMLLDRASNQKQGM